MTLTTRALRNASLAALAAVLAACGGADSSNDRGALKANTQTAAMPRAMIDAAVASLPGLQSLIGGAAKCDVSINGIIYDTRDPRNNDAEASAGVLIPSGPGCAGPYPIVVYHHGATVIKADTMSSPTNAEMNLQLMMYAAQGYIVVMPDYHGYSGSTMNYHPFLQADITAIVSIDALRAARKLLTDRGVATSGKLFLAGYSQGGHAAMATQRALEKDYTSEFTVTASVPMAGPYALSQTVLNSLDVPLAGGTIFTSMAVVGLQKRYGDIYTQASDVFQSPWVNGIENLLPGSIASNDLFRLGKLPLALTGTGGLLTSDFVSGYKANVNHPARRRVAEHDLLNFKPRAVTTLCHGSRDPTVPVANMTSAATYFAGQGATVGAVDVELVPAFKPGIDAQVAAAGGLGTYHGSIVPPLCASVARSVFDPLR